MSQLDETTVREIVYKILDPIMEDIKSLTDRVNMGDKWQSRYGEKIDWIEKSVVKLTVMIENMAKVPEQRWNNVVGGLISALIGAAIGILASKIGGK